MDPREPSEGPPQADAPASPAASKGRSSSMNSSSTGSESGGQGARSPQSKGRGRSPRALSPGPKVLRVPSQWAGTVSVDITGIAPSAVTTNYTSAPPGKASLLSIDIDNFTEPFVLDSPRSAYACLRLGIQPTELVKKPFAQVVADAEKVTGAGRVDRLSAVDVECCKREYAHHEVRRRQKYAALLKQREELLENAGLMTGVPTDGSRRASALFAQEERKLQKIADANQALLRQRLHHERKLKLLKHERERSLQAELEADARAKEAQRVAEQEREAEGEERQRLVELKKSLEKRQQQAILARKQRLYDEKERSRRAELDRKKRAVEHVNRARAAASEKRQKQRKTQNTLLVEQRREHLLTRIERTEMLKMEHEEQRTVQVRERQQQAKTKQAKIQAALERSAQARQMKIMRALEKEARANEALEEYAHCRAKVVEERRALEEEKEVKRKLVYEEAQRLMSQRVDHIVQRQELQQKHFAELQRRKEDDQRLRHALQQLKQSDKVENVVRMKKVNEFKKYLTIEKIEDKCAKVREIATEKERLMVKRSKHRAAVEAARVPVTHQTPGPGDYLGSDAPLLKSSPKWKFGVSANNFPMRVIASDRLSRGFAPGYVPSPGPCAYSVNESPARKKPPAALISKADRFTENFVSPGDPSR